MLWAAFIAFVIAMLAIDLGLFHRSARVVSVREAGAWSAVWIALAACFAGLLWATMGSEPALLFATGYVIEKSLSVDNLFVFVVIFGALHIGREHQQLALAVGFVGRPMHIALRQRVELRFEFRVQAIDIAHVEVITETPIAGNQWVPLAFFEDAHPAALALDVRIPRLPIQQLEAEDVDEEVDRRPDIGDMHERRDLQEVHRPPCRPSSAGSAFACARLCANSGKVSASGCSSGKT